MENYQPVKDDLQKRRSEILDRLHRVKKHLRHTDKPLEADFAEQAVERENDEVLEVLEKNMLDEIMQIDQAIFRIDKGKYGFCKNCGKEIHKKRLLILPFTSFCINCAA
jgi:RNA polymerase-binding protein DksA